MNSKTLTKAPLTGRKPPKPPLSRSKIFASFRRVRRFSLYGVNQASSGQTVSTDLLLTQLLDTVSDLKKDVRALRENEKHLEQLLSLRTQLLPAEGSGTQLPEPTKPVSGAEAALQAMRHRLELSAPVQSDASPKVDFSEKAKQEWVTSGRIVGWKALASAWGDRSRQSLDQASQRGELFSLMVAGKRMYPAAFLNLSAEAVKDINLALKDVDPVSKLIFWNRPHGALGNKTLAEAIEDRQLDRAIHLAQAFSSEYLGHAAVA